MSGGGAERQLATLANELVNDYEITIVTFCDINDHYYLNPSIKRIRLGYRRSRCMICRFLRTIIYFNKVNTDESNYIRTTFKFFGIAFSLVSEKHKGDSQ